MERDIVTHFTRFSSIKQKKFHESFVILNKIPHTNIDFERSYIIIYSRLKPKEKFDLLEHSQEIKFLDYFQCKCKKEKPFRPDLWQYDNCHSDQQCLFRRRYDYFRLLQSVNPNISEKEKLTRKSSKSSLM